MYNPFRVVVGLELRPRVALRRKGDTADPGLRCFDAFGVKIAETPTLGDQHLWITTRKNVGLLRLRGFLLISLGFDTCPTLD